VKPHLAAIVFVWLLCVGIVYGEDESISRKQLRFLEHQHQPLFVADVTKRLGAVDGRKGCFCYPYKVRGEKTTIDFWMVLPPRNPPPPPEGRPVEIAMIVERRDGVPPKIIWPRSLRGNDIETAKKRFYPHGW
jgi:hypothetical protein